MKKSLFVTLDYPPAHGGVARYYHNLIRRWDPAQVTVLAPLAAESQAFDQCQECKVVRRQFLFNSPLLWPKWIRLVFELFRIIQEEKIEVLLVGQVLPVGSAAYIVNRFRKIPYIIFTHGLDITYPQAYPRKKRMMLRVLAGAHQVVANSEYTKKELIKLGIPQDKIVVLTPGCNMVGRSVSEGRLDSIKNKYHLAGSRILLTVSRLKERKGHDMVIKALAQLKDKLSDLKYVVVGSGEYESALRSLADKLGVADRVVFVGSVSDEDLPAYYQLADVFIMPSRELSNRDVEGFGIVYLEANSFAIPVVGGHSGGVGEAIVDGQTGLLVDPNCLEDIATAINRLFTDKSYAERLGLAGQQRVLKDFRWSSRAKELEDIIKQS